MSVGRLNVARLRVLFTLPCVEQPVIRAVSESHVVVTASARRQLRGRAARVARVSHVSD